MSNNFYVYVHKHPDNPDTIVYIGKGKHGRAWDVTRARTSNKDHQEWMIALGELGYTPDDWVDILHKGLSEKEAFTTEKNLIHSNGRPEFNRQSGELQHQAKLTNKQAREIYSLCEHGGFTHKRLAEHYSVSRATISMIAAGKQWRAITHDLRGINE